MKKFHFDEQVISDKVVGWICEWRWSVRQKMMDCVMKDGGWKVEMSYFHLCKPDNPMVVLVPQKLALGRARCVGIIK